MANVYPPSPALSACDSLADIEDLDAFLDAQGPLSHLPTPPAAEKKASTIVAAYDYHSDSEDSEDDEADEELWRIASALTDLVSGRYGSTDTELELVIKILLRAQVPPEILALTYNILTALSPHVMEEPIDVGPLHPDLAVAACLILATIFIHDDPPAPHFWARRVCRGTWTARRIQDMVLGILRFPGVRMLALSHQSALDKALRELWEISKTPKEVKDHVSEREENTMPGSHEAPAPLKLAMSDSTQWVNGTITPAETPVVEPTSFLRLL